MKDNRKSLYAVRGINGEIWETICGIGKDGMNYNVKESAELCMFSDGWVDAMMKYQHRYVYGAGNVAHRLFIFLRSDGISVDGVLVTGELEKQRKDGVCWPLVRYSKQINKESLIMVAIDSPLHQDVIENLRRDGYKNVIHAVIQWYELNQMITEDYYPESLKEWYYQVHHTPLNLEHPQLFNEKICWLKLYDKKIKLKTILADKYKVKEWVGNRIGYEYVVQTYGVWDCFDEIDFENLPNRFALKCNHGNGFNALVYDKKTIDYKCLKNQFDEWMQINPAYKTLELQYMNTEHKIIAEKLLTPDKGDEDIKDYKFFVFEGKVKLIQVDIDRFHGHRRKLFTPEWDVVDARIGFPDAPDIIVERPKDLMKMISISECLGAEFHHVRVDLYISEGKIYFGEMTFSHGGGSEEIIPESLSLQMGAWISLPMDISNS